MKYIINHRKSPVSSQCQNKTLLIQDRINHPKNSQEVTKKRISQQIHWAISTHYNPLQSGHPIPTLHQDFDLLLAVGVSVWILPCDDGPVYQVRRWPETAVSCVFTRRITTTYKQNMFIRYHHSYLAWPATLLKLSGAWSPIHHQKASTFWWLVHLQFSWSTISCKAFLLEKF